MTRIAALLLILILASAHPLLAAQDPDDRRDWITLRKPPPGQTVSVQMQPNLGLQFAFDAARVHTEIIEQHLVIRFLEDDARLVLLDLLDQPLETIVYAVDGHVYAIAPVVEQLLEENGVISGRPYGHIDDSYSYPGESGGYYSGGREGDYASPPPAAPRPVDEDLPRPAPAEPAKAPAAANGGGAGAPTRGVRIGGGTAAAPAQPASREPAAREPQPESDLEAILEEEELAPAAGAPTPDADETSEPDLAGLRHTGRDLLFTDELEAGGYPLYSYLLVRSSPAGEQRQRFEQAISAFVGQVREAAAMEAAGARRETINIFYAPTRRFFVDTSAESMRVHFSAQDSARQREMLLANYDFVRAELLLDTLGLRDPGPYIVTLLEPLTGLERRGEAPWLVQNLSSVPPELVALWVDEFKRQVLQEAQGSPEGLRRFALHLRTEISVFAEAFAITKAAVAEMFAAPGEPAP